MKTILLIISGGIAAYKALELIRLLKKDGARVIPVLTKGGAQFVTPLSASALAEEKAYSDLFSLTDEMEMGHIRLSRIADLIVVAPASADIIAKMAHGLADDLASTLLLASNKPILIAPAMNPMMWANAATQSNIQTLKVRGIHVAGPASGDMACGEEGVGRLLEPTILHHTINEFLAVKGPLNGKKALVTAGPTREPIDPVRYISNHSSGKQGYAVAEALRDAGADVTLISGPVNLEAPHGVRMVNVNTAQEMLEAVTKNLPADIAICAAAVADWRVENTAAQKLKKDLSQCVVPENAKHLSGISYSMTSLQLTENPDILFTLSTHKTLRPKLVVGFAAETQNVEMEAGAKFTRKQCDMLVANDVSSGVFGADENKVLFIGKNDVFEPWPRMTKQEVARWLVERIVKQS